MATSGRVILWISHAAGVAPSTVMRMLQPLRDAGLVPIGVRGRGQTVGVYEPPHYACLALGFAGAQPSDAAKAAETLRHLQWRHSEKRRENPSPIDAPRVPGSIEQVLATIIAGDLGPLGEGKTPSLVLSLKPPQVIVMWPDGQVETYGLPEGTARVPRKAGVGRQTVLWGVMLDIAIALWRDTPKSADLPGRRSALTFVRHKAERSLEHSDSTAGRFAFQQPRSPDGEKVDCLDEVAP
jgi:hypothetical protein